MIKFGYIPWNELLQINSILTMTQDNRQQSLCQFCFIKSNKKLTNCWNKEKSIIFENTHYMCLILILFCRKKITAIKELVHSIK